MEPLFLTFPAALVMGLAFGAGPCTITCLPYLGPVLFSERRSWRTVSLFSLGRLTGYTSLGAVSGVAGQVITEWAEDGTAGLVLGLATVVIGILLLRRLTPSNTCGATVGGQSKAMPLRQFTREKTTPPAAAWNGGLFFMGMGMAFNPCVPLGSVLLAAATTGQVLDGAWLGMGFGVGAVFIPTLVFGGAVAWFGKQLRANLGGLRLVAERGAAVLLVVLGVATALGVVQT